MKLLDTIKLMIFIVHVYSQSVLTLCITLFLQVVLHRCVLLLLLLLTLLLVPVMYSETSEQRAQWRRTSCPPYET